VCGFRFQLRRGQFHRAIDRDLIDARLFVGHRIARELLLRLLAKGLKFFAPALRALGLELVLLRMLAHPRGNDDAEKREDAHTPNEGEAQ
jgi:hypothetical protein